ncbi:hypothetical protein IL992_33060 [Microbispora sp. NEAU-D428]|uniref:hypothetical protein n=1 Tax=Microbispora sitophila TaxID=2771537 RepID=UPI001866556A|nr:hypothetical protein [Microbispora sitophila]MBE3013977.1 hypothetical protein [Microbispora sitophila]
MTAYGRPLTAAAAELASALFQNFGAAEALQIWPDGTVNPGTWGRQRQCPVAHSVVEFLAADGYDEGQARRP